MTTAYSSRTLDPDKALRTLTKKLKYLRDNCKQRIRVHHRPVPWWNSDLTTLRHEYKHLRRRIQQYRKKGLFDISLDNTYRKSRAQYKKALSQAKTAQWEDNCKALTTIHPYGRFFMTLRKRNKDTLLIPTLYRDDGSMTNNTRESLELLLDKNFHDQRRESQGLYPKLPIITRDLDITTQEILDAFREIKPGTATGPDRLDYHTMSLVITSHLPLWQYCSTQYFIKEFIRNLGRKDRSDSYQNQTGIYMRVAHTDRSPSYQSSLVY